MDAIESVDADVEIDETESVRPNWSNFLFEGCSYGSSLSESESEDGCSSSLGQK